MRWPSLFLISLPFISLSFAQLTPSKHHTLLARGKAKPKFDKYFELTVSEGKLAPDGVSRTVFLVNGQFPGPEIVVDEDDYIGILVTNKLKQRTTMHWHGLWQRESPWSDGVPGVTQTPIEPGKKFLYKFHASGQAGAYWYHSHYAGQTADGIKGPFTIRPKKSRPSPFSCLTKKAAELKQMKAAFAAAEPIVLSDWRHLSSPVIMENYKVSGVDPICLDSLLINGHGRVICPDVAQASTIVSPLVLPLTEKACLMPNSSLLTDIPGRPVFPGLAIRSTFFGCKATKSPFAAIEVNEKAGFAVFSLMNTADVYELKFTIDQHSFWVFAADGQDITPQQAQVVTIPVGERYQILVPLKNSSQKEYAIRVTINGLPQVAATYAVLRYTSKPRRGQTTSTLPVAPDLVQTYNAINSRSILDPLSIKPIGARTIPKKSTQSITLHLRHPAARQFTVNNFSPHPNWIQDVKKPVLYDYNVLKPYNASINIPLGAVVDLIMDIEAPLAPPHPIHLHGTKAWVIGQGDFPRNFSSVADAQAKGMSPFFNLKDAPYRDSFNTPAAIFERSWMVVRYEALHAGPIINHCHIGQHFGTGMAVTFLVGTQKQLPPIPREYRLGGNGL